VQPKVNSNEIIRDGKRARRFKKMKRKFRKASKSLWSSQVVSGGSEPDSTNKLLFCISRELIPAKKADNQLPMLYWGQERPLYCFGNNYNTFHK